MGLELQAIGCAWFRVQSLGLRKVLSVGSFSQGLF